jgi:hypothetical protein
VHRRITDVASIGKMLYELNKCYRKPFSLWVHAVYHIGFYLFFVDDLILFGEASRLQMNVISSCFSTSYDASCAKVSVEKTKMLVSQNVNGNRARELSNMSGLV